MDRDLLTGVILLAPAPDGGSERGAVWRAQLPTAHWED